MSTAIDDRHRQERPSDSARPLLSVRDLDKSYAGVAALAGVGLDVKHGSIHAIAGQNGAGKSTLIKILSGAETPDAGTIEVDGRAVRLNRPQDAQHAGLQTIYQELSLVPDLSVAENIFLGEPPRGRAGYVDWSSMHRQARDAIERVGFRINVRVPVRSLSAAEQQAVELAKALHRDARVLLLDEPTSTLSVPDAKRLFTVLRALSKDGVTMLYISHRMDELFDLCDAVTVLRDGQVVTSAAMADTNADEIVSAMVGSGSARQRTAMTGADKELVRGIGTGNTVDGPPLLRVDGIGDGERFADVSFDLHKGEVLGLVGLVGSGQSELADCLAGARRRTTGAVSLDGHPINLSSPRGAIRAGIGLLPQDRKTQGFVPEMSVAGNISLASLPMFSRFALRNERREKHEAQRMATGLGMKIASVNQPMRTLSGGTQQKAILARWLVREARILVCDEPTRGVDVAAKEDIYDLFRDYVADGGTIVLASSEVPEALMCDRVIVLSRGRVVAEITRDQMDPQGDAIVRQLS